MERGNHRVSLHADLRGLSYHHARVVPSDAPAALSRPMKRPLQIDRMVAVAYCRLLVRAKFCVTAFDEAD